MTPQEFSQKIKAKYPEYGQMDDVELTKKIIQKYPQYHSQVNLAQPKDASSSSLGSNIKDAASSSFEKQKQGMSMMQTAQNPVDLVAGGLKTAAGAVGVAFSPLTGAAKPLLDKAAPAFAGAVDKLSNTKAFREYGEGSVGTDRDTATRTLDAVVDGSEVFGAFGGPKVAKPLAIGAAAKVGPVAGAVASKATQLPARGVSEIQGALTGTSGETIRQAFNAARAGGKELDEFTSALRGKTTPEQLVNRLREGTEQINAEKSARFGQMIETIGDQPVTTTNIASEVAQDLQKIGVKINGDGSLNFSESKFRTVPQAATKLQAMYDEVLRLGDQQTVKGVDTSRQALAALMMTGDDASAKTANMAITGAINRVRTAGKSVKGYGEALTQFGDDSEFLNEITRALSSGDKATIDTAYRKLATTLKTNNEQRRNLLSELDQATGGYILSAVAGQQLSEELPRGIFRQIAAGMAGVSVATGGVSAGLLPALVFASPRVTGEVLRALGIAAGKVDGLLGAFSKVKAELKIPSTDIDTPIKNYVDEAQPGLSMKSSVSPANVAKRLDAEDATKLNRYAAYPDDAHAFIEIQPLLEQIGIANADQATQLRFIRETLSLWNSRK
jgi:hypothetical protein